MNTPRGLGLRALVFGALTVALGVFIIVRLVTEGFVAKDSFAILVWFLGVGTALDVGYKWRKATRDRATPSSVDHADGDSSDR